MHAVFLVQLVCQIAMVTQQRRDLRQLPVVLNLNLINEVGPQAAAAPDDSYIRSRAIQNRLPFRFEKRKEMIAKPIHVIKQNKK